MSQILGHPRWPTTPLASCAGRQPARKWKKAERSNLTQRDKPSGAEALGRDCKQRRYGVDFHIERDRLIRSPCVRFDFLRGFSASILCKAAPTARAASG